MIKDLTVSKGNFKLPVTTTILNLPTKLSCIQITKDCSRCYAEKAEKMRPCVLPCRVRNMQSTKKKTFVYDLIKLIDKSKNLVFRYHESGDFYSQDYLNKAFQIAIKRPKVFFYAYSKSTKKLNFKNRPKNFRLIDSLCLKASKHKAKVIFENDSIPKGFFVCPGSCKKCNYCFNPKTKNVLVAFPLH